MTGVLHYTCFVLVVHQLLEDGTCLTPTPQMMADLQSLACALLESLNDKNVALSHQRKTNKFVMILVLCSEFLEKPIAHEQSAVHLLVVLCTGNITPCKFGLGQLCAWHIIYPGIQIPCSYRKQLAYLIFRESSESSVDWYQQKSDIINALFIMRHV
jgi:Uncharacterized coiled-coil protein (DUF2353)